IALVLYICFFFFQAEDGIRDWSVTGVQTCALPISHKTVIHMMLSPVQPVGALAQGLSSAGSATLGGTARFAGLLRRTLRSSAGEIGRASCRERVEVSVVDGSL